MKSLVLLYSAHSSRPHRSVHATYPERQGHGSGIRHLHQYDIDTQPSLVLDMLNSRC